MGRAVLWLTVAAVALLGVAAPAMAGGFATVRLDEPPGAVYVEVPWRFGFVVKQHDVTPTNDVTPAVLARHKESGDEVRTIGRQDGPIGHFVAELTFPRAGAWKWAIAPAPFPETSFETLTVLTGPGAASSSAAQTTPPARPTKIHRGTCADLGEVAFPLGDVAPGPWQGGAQPPQNVPAEERAVPVAVGVTTVEAGLDELVATSHAIDVRQSAENGAASVACGDLAGHVVGDELVVGLQKLNDSGDVGVVILRGDGDRTTVTLYMLAVDRPPGGEITAAPAGPTAAVEIVGGSFDVAAFEPASLTVVPGTTVTWTNAGADAHTVTGDDLAFDDSGPLDPGQSFSQTFDEPGTYRYRCGPHPWMEGVITVT